MVRLPLCNLKQHCLLVDPCNIKFFDLSGDFIDWATAVVGEGDTCKLSVSFTYYRSGPIYKTLAQSMEFDGYTFCVLIQAY